MQRAVSISKQANATKIAHIQQSEIERLYDLLPHGLQTHHDIDVYRLLVKCKSYQWKIPIPTTLLSTSSGPILLTTTPKHTVELSKLSSDSSALDSFLSTTHPNPSPKSRFPKFTLRTESSMTTFYSDFPALKDAWTANKPSVQMAQEYLHPPSPSVSILKAHWQKGKKRVTYYIITNKQGKAGLSATHGKLPCLVRRLAECNSVESSHESLLRRKCSVSVKSAAESWALKSFKQIPEVNDTMIEVKKLLECCYVQTRQRVAEIVCDFVSDSQRKWVFLKCKGCYFDAATKQFSQNYEHKKKIDMNFILFPVVDQPKVMKQRIRAASRSENVDSLNSFDRRINFLGISMKSKSKNDESGKKFDWGKLHKGPFHRTESEAGLEVTSAVQEYENAMGSMLKYKLALNTPSDFVQKYGGVSAFGEPLGKVCAGIRGNRDRNVEERRMMVRGWVRVIEGTVGRLEKDTLQVIHRHMGITHGEFQEFVQQIETALFHLEISSIDVKAISGRFQKCESYICTEEG